MPAAYLPVPPTHAAEASARIRQAGCDARTSFTQGALAVRPDLSRHDVAVLWAYAQDSAAVVVEACFSPEAWAVLSEMAATGQEAEPGEDVPA